MSETMETAVCACSDCMCKVDAATGVQRDGKSYCCEACANHHAAGAACSHSGCGCHG